MYIPSKLKKSMTLGNNKCQLFRRKKNLYPYEPAADPTRAAFYNFFYHNQKKIQPSIYKESGKLSNLVVTNSSRLFSLVLSSTDFFIK